MWYSKVGDNKGVRDPVTTQRKPSMESSNKIVEHGTDAMTGMRSQ